MSTEDLDAFPELLPGLEWPDVEPEPLTPDELADDALEAMGYVRQAVRAADPVEARVNREIALRCATRLRWALQLERTAS